jgi:hypothetical protein
MQKFIPSTKNLIFLAAGALIAAALVKRGKFPAFLSF